VCTGTGDACEIEKAPERELDFTLLIAEHATVSGVPVPFTDAELTWRTECVSRWLTQLGLSPAQVRDGNALRVTSVWSELERVVNSAAVCAVDVNCARGDCTHCNELTEVECSQDGLCAPHVAWPFDEQTEQCLEPRFAECVRADMGCADAPGFTRDRDGRCWYYTGTECDDLVYLKDDSTCGDPGVERPSCQHR
jgi:hypothetical protein